LCWSVEEQWKKNGQSKFQMKHLFLAKGLWGVVDGSEALTESASEGMAAQFLSKSQRAIRFLDNCFGNSTVFGQFV
jgi:hypothetical protein